MLLVSWLSALPVQGDAMDWYKQLKRPSFTPPGWSFSVVWPILYVLMTISAWRIWLLRHNESVGPALLTFCVQLAINLVWSYLFFGLRSPMLGFAWIIVLLPLIMLTILQFERHSRGAAQLLLPYLAWTGFAMVLAYKIWRLN
ncbi:MAG: tryptophan-rich sensory protein [Rickettsiales bacterium]|nr:tryptophan-rich sensory protein [Rickettsiales bacterium]